MENLVPLTEDLLVETPLAEIIRGLEGLIREDLPLATGASFEEGDWAVLNNDGELEAPGASPKANTFLVWAGNAEGRSDVHATGKCTVLTGGNFVYRTTKFNDGTSYQSGDPITVKSLGSGAKTPTKATGSEIVLGRVRRVFEGMLEIEVVRN